MRRKSQRLGANAKLFQQLATVPMTEDTVRGKIIRRVHKMRLCRRSLARTAYAALSIGDDAMPDVHKACSDKRLQRQNDRCSIATGIGNEAGAADLRAMQFRHDLHGLSLRLQRSRRTLIFEMIDSA